MKRFIKELTEKVKEIMDDFCTDYLTIECCDFHIQGCIITHCYYDDENDKIIFSSGDMFTDKHAEEIKLTDDDTIIMLKEVINAYD